jgi:hypothetical protein
VILLSVASKVAYVVEGVVHVQYPALSCHLKSSIQELLVTAEPVGAILYCGQFSDGVDAVDDTEYWLARLWQYDI